MPNPGALSTYQTLAIVIGGFIGIPLGFAIILWVIFGVWQSATDLFVHSTLSESKKWKRQRLIRVGWILSLIALYSVLTAPSGLRNRRVIIPTDYRTGAICNDRTPSTATGEGACSYHGGVDHWRYERVETVNEIDEPGLRKRKTHLLFGYIMLPFVLLTTGLGMIVFSRDKASLPPPHINQQSALEATATNRKSFIENLTEKIRLYPLSSFIYTVTPLAGSIWLFAIESDRPMINAVLGVFSGSLIGLLILQEEGPITLIGLLKRWLLQVTASALGIVAAYFILSFMVIAILYSFALRIWEEVMGTRNNFMSKD